MFFANIKKENIVRDVIHSNLFQIHLWKCNHIHLSTGIKYFCLEWIKKLVRTLDYKFIHGCLEKEKNNFSDTRLLRRLAKPLISGMLVSLDSGIVSTFPHFSLRGLKTNEEIEHHEAAVVSRGWMKMLNESPLLLSVL